MVGRLNEAKQFIWGERETFPGGVELMKELGPPLDYHLWLCRLIVGGSDHVSFYKKKHFRFLGIHTGGHPQYHPWDTARPYYFGKVRKQVCGYYFQRYYGSALQPSLCYEIFISPRGIRITFVLYIWRIHKIILECKYYKLIKWPFYWCGLFDFMV